MILVGVGGIGLGGAGQNLQRYVHSYRVVIQAGVGVIAAVAAEEAAIAVAVTTAIAVAAVAAVIVIVGRVEDGDNRVGVLIAEHGNADGVALLMSIEDRGQIVQRGNAGAIDLGDEVISLESSLIGGAVRGYFTDDYACRRPAADRIVRAAEGAAGYAQGRTANLAIVDKLLSDRQGGIDRDSKAKPRPS